MINLIGFTGGMGVGKSTAIDLLKDRCSGVVLAKFAQPLYDMQEFIYNRIYPTYQRPANFVKDRKLLQWLGTDWGRDTISQTLWVDLWKNDVIHLIRSTQSIVVCDDVRFDNEAQAVKELGGVVIKITSDRAAERINTLAGIKNHASEAGVDKKFVDALIANNGSLQEYTRLLTVAFDTLGISTAEEIGA